MTLTSRIFSIVVGSALVLVPVTAGPVYPRASSSSGAAYFMTNDPSGNFIVSANIGSDGKLSLSEAVSTRGNGLHGNDAPAANGPDGLFSQGCVKASQHGNILANVNPGSSTVSLFSIDPNNPSRISLIGEPVSSEGEFPMSVAINKNGTMVCALNGGAVNGVNCYSVDKKKGLIPIPNTLRSLGINQTTPATGPAGTASHIIFNDNESQLLASVKGVPPTPGFIAAWDIKNGSLSENFTKIAPPKGGVLPFSMTVVPGKSAVLVTDPGVGLDIFDLSANVKSASGNSTASGNSSAVPIAGQGATCWSSHSQKTGNFYLTDIMTSTVTEVNVDKNLKGTIVKQYPQANNSATIDNDIATINGKDFMYVLSANATTIDVLALNGAGNATKIQSADVSQMLKSAGVPFDRNNLQGMTTFVKV